MQNHRRCSHKSPCRFCLECQLQGWYVILESLSRTARRSIASDLDPLERCDQHYPIKFVSRTSWEAQVVNASGTRYASLGLLAACLSNIMIASYQKWDTVTFCMSPGKLHCQVLTGDSPYKQRLIFTTVNLCRARWNASPSVSCILISGLNNSSRVEVIRTWLETEMKTSVRSRRPKKETRQFYSYSTWILLSTQRSSEGVRAIDDILVQPYSSQRDV